mgnify:CR=1 FL=1
MMIRISLNVVTFSFFHCSFSIMFGCVRSLAKARGTSRLDSERFAFRFATELRSPAVAIFTVCFAQTLLIVHPFVQSSIHPNLNVFILNDVRPPCKRAGNERKSTFKCVRTMRSGHTPVPVRKRGATGDHGKRQALQKAFHVMSLKD